MIFVQAAVYVATASKSNVSYIGINDALRDLESMNVGEIPYHIKDMTASSIERKKNDQFSDKAAYKYPHAYENNYVEQQYLPDNLLGKKYYNSSNNGYEEKITNYLNKIRDHSDQ